MELPPSNIFASNLFLLHLPLSSSILLIIIIPEHSEPVMAYMIGKEKNYMLEVMVHIEEGIAILKLRGRFDGLGAQLFEQQVNARIGEEKQWLIDFQEVSYLSSAGIRSLIKYGKRVNKVDGKIILCYLNNEVRNVLEITGVLQLFGHSGDIAGAIAGARESLRQARHLDSSMQTFSALGRECTMQVLSAEECKLDIWNPLPADSLKNLDASQLIAASCEEVNLAFGIGALGCDSQNALEGLGSFLALEKIIGVLPADGFNQPDYMINQPSSDTHIYLAGAAGFSGAAWARFDLGEGPTVLLKDVRQVILARLQELRQEKVPLIGMLALVQLEAGQGSYFNRYEDLIDHKLMQRKLPDHQTMLLLGLSGGSDWPADEHLTRLVGQRGIQSDNEFFLAHGMVFSEELDWSSQVKEPGDIGRYFSRLDLMQDLLIVDEDTAISSARVWIYIPGVIRSGLEKQLQIEVTGDAPFPAEWEVITRRLYTDAGRVILEPLTGGFSDGKPFRVTAYDQDNRRMLPTVLKLGPHDLIQMEIVNHQKYVHNYILNNSTTIMGQANYKTATGMRFNFVGIGGPESKLEWLTNRYRERDIADLKALFDKIFTSILKPWYGQPVWEMIRPYQEHNPLIKFPSILEAAHQAMGISPDDEYIDCPELGRALPNPYYFLNYEYPARQSNSQLWYTGINHGDLNMQNILLDERDNVYIIDFSETRSRNIVSDFARLEPIFKLEMTRMQDESDLKSMLDFEQVICQIDFLDQLPAYVYQGTDPTVSKAYEMICLIRRYANTVTIFENDIIPYLLAMLEWTYPVVIYRQVTPQGRKMATYSAALIVEQIMRIEGQRA